MREEHSGGEDTLEDLSMNRRELYYGGFGINGRDNLLQNFYESIGEYLL